MGSGSFDAAAYSTFSRSTAGKSTAHIYTSSGINKDLDPKNIAVRESRDSADNPNATPIIVALDVTGSMGILADVIAREGLGTLFRELLDSKPVSDPHLMFMGIGDANYDSAPLQVSQFEADNRIVDQLTKLYLEHGGGGNGFESYNFPWYFAAAHTEIDCFIKRAKKGYLFTVGDEEAPGDLTNAQIEEFTGDRPERSMKTAEMLADAQRKYHVFHIMIAEGNHARSHEDRVRSTWLDLLGERAVWLKDHKKLAETIVGIIEVNEGRDHASIGKKFGGVVLDAVKNLPKGSSSPRLALNA